MPELPSSTTPTAAQMNIALLLIRIASALAFLYHGSAILFGAFATFAVVDLVSVVQRGAVKAFTPRLRADVICIVAGSALALLVMTFHRILFGPVVVSFGV